LRILAVHRRGGYAGRGFSHKHAAIRPGRELSGSQNLKRSFPVNLTIPLVLLDCSLGVAALSAVASPSGVVVLETPHVQYPHFGRSGESRLRGPGDGNRLPEARRRVPVRLRPCRRQGASGHRRRLGRRTVDAALRRAGLEAALRVETRADYLRFTVESVTGGEPEVLTFLHVPLTLQGRPEEPPAGRAGAPPPAAHGAPGTARPYPRAVRRLRLLAEPPDARDQLPALQTELRAACHAKFGLVWRQGGLGGRAGKPDSHGPQGSAFRGRRNAALPRGGAVGGRDAVQPRLVSLQLRVAYRNERHRLDRDGPRPRLQPD